MISLYWSQTYFLLWYSLVFYEISHSVHNNQTKCNSGVTEPIIKAHLHKSIAALMGQPFIILKDIMTFNYCSIVVSENQLFKFICIFSVVENNRNKTSEQLNRIVKRAVYLVHRIPVHKYFMFRRNPFSSL